MLRVMGLRHRGVEIAENAEHRPKNLREVTAALIMMIAVAPLLVIAAFAIKYESSGPVLSRDRRLRSDGRPYWRLRFRTTARCPKLHTLLTERERVTRVGQFLRTTRIEHLPQLINVLRQEITIREIDFLT